MSDRDLLTAIETREVWFAYPEGDDALKSVTLRIQSGEFVALVGPNGSGKTTLAKLMLGLLRPQRGQVKIQGEDIHERAVGEVARSVGYVFQNPDHQIFAATVREEISFGPRNLRLSEAEVEARSDRAMERFGLAPLAERQPAMLSQGVRRKVALASVYAMDPEIWLLDEPTGALDWLSAQETMELLQELNGDGKTIVLITHDMRLVAEHARRCVVLSGGSIAADDETRSVFAQSEHLGISPPAAWRISAALNEGPSALTTQNLCKVIGAMLAAESEIDVSRS